MTESRYSRRKKQRSTDDHNQQERYLLTYADMITLLLGLFVILYASSQTDASKFQEVATAMNKYFQPNHKKADSLHNVSALPGGNGVLQGQQGVPQQMYRQDGSGMQAPISDEQIESDVRSALGGLLQNGSADVLRMPEGIIVRLGEGVLFESGKAQIRPTSTSMLDTLARALARISRLRNIVFVGHTDSINIRSFQFESNWHLSTARSLAVAYYCIEHGVYDKYVEVQGVGSQQPIADNATQEGRNRNRRVEILIREIPPQRPTTQGYVNSP